MRELVKLFAQILKQMMLQNRDIKYIQDQLEDIMGQLEDLQAAITAIQEKVDADVEQDKKVVEAINALLAKLPNTPDLQPFIDQLKAAADKLSGDNAEVQAAIDAAVPPSNP